MKILGIESASLVASVAVVSDGLVNIPWILKRPIPRRCFP